MAAIDLGSFPLETARGNTIPPTVVVPRMAIGRLQIDLAALRVEIHSPTVRQAHDNRSAGRAATCQALAVVVASVAVMVLVAAMVRAAAVGSAVLEREAERTA